MSLLQRLLRLLGYSRPPKLSFQMDEEMVETLGEISRREQRSEQEIAADLIHESITRRREAEERLACWTNLSPREQDVAALTCLNYTNRQIAQRLSISPETVKTHVSNVLRKLDVRNKSELRQLLKDWDFSAWDKLEP